MGSSCSNTGDERNECSWGKGAEVSMNKYFRRLSRAVRKQSGQSLVEYALILALIAVVAILVLQGLGSKVNNTLSTVNANLP